MRIKATSFRKDIDTRESCKRLTMTAGTLVEGAALAALNTILMDGWALDDIVGLYRERIADEAAEAANTAGG